MGQVDTQTTVAEQRRARVAKAVDEWMRQLIDLSGRNRLLYYQTLKRGTLELTGAAPVSLGDLLAGSKVRLSHLMFPTRDDPDRQVDAVKRARTIHGKALTFYEERGIDTLCLAVKHMLEQAGFAVIPQYGVSRFRIDFAIPHPNQPGRMALDIEADGASYHSSTPLAAATGSASRYSNGSGGASTASGPPTGSTTPGPRPNEPSQVTNWPCVSRPLADGQANLRAAPGTELAVPHATAHRPEARPRARTRYPRLPTQPVRGTRPLARTRRPATNRGTAGAAHDGRTRVSPSRPPGLSRRQPPSTPHEVRVDDMTLSTVHNFLTACTRIQTAMSAWHSLDRRC
jgi:hypothetical protein